MTQPQFNREFKANTTNWKCMTLTDRRLCYNEMMQAYASFGNITQKQLYNWGHPKFLTSHINKIDTSKY